MQNNSRQLFSYPLVIYKRMAHYFFDLETPTFPEILNVLSSVVPKDDNALVNMTIYGVQEKRRYSLSIYTYGTMCNLLPPRPRRCERQKNYGQLFRSAMVRTCSPSQPWYTGKIRTCKLSPQVLWCERNLISKMSDTSWIPMNVIWSLIDLKEIHRRLNPCKFR